MSEEFLKSIKLISADLTRQEKKNRAGRFKRARSSSGNDHPGISKEG